MRAWWHNAQGWEPRYDGLLQTDSWPMLFANDSSSVVNMLRSCLRQGECQVSPEQTVHQHAAEERERERKEKRENVHLSQQLRRLHLCLLLHHTSQLSSHNRVSKAIRQLPLRLNLLEATCRCAVLESLDRRYTNESSVKVNVPAILARRHKCGALQRRTCTFMRPVISPSPSPRTNRQQQRLKSSVKGQ